MNQDGQIDLRGVVRKEAYGDVPVDKLYADSEMITDILKGRAICAEVPRSTFNDVQRRISMKFSAESANSVARNARQFMSSKFDEEGEYLG